MSSKYKRVGTKTSSFGSPGRIGHDSTPFYTSKLYEGLPKEEMVKYVENPIRKSRKGTYGFSRMGNCVSLLFSLYYGIFNIVRLVKTVKCKLEVNQQERQSILETISRFTQACNDALEIARENKIWNTYKLHHACYYSLKEKYQLTSNYIIRAIARVTTKRQRKPKSFKGGSIELDKDLFSIEAKERISLATIGGRLKLKLSIGNYQRGLLKGQKPKSATLIYNKRKKAFYINFVLEKEVPTPFGGNSVGVDLGINNIATTSNGLRFSGKKAIHIRKHFAKLRQSLQRKGTKSSLRRLKWLSGREQRWMADLNHRISKRIVESCKEGDVIVFENLTHIRKRMRVARKQRLIQHSWSFSQLQTFIAYKALEKGIPVIFIDPAYTSKTCSRCGSLGSRIRHSFFCSCGYRNNADYSATFNISSRGHALLVGALSKSPDVGSTDKPAALAVGV